MSGTIPSGKAHRTATRPHVVETLKPGAWVARDVIGVPLSIVNAYLVGPLGAPDRGWVLVDAGLATSADRIVAEAARRFAPGARPAAILLTHGHFDHIGALRELSDRWLAPVFAHRLEVPYLTGQSAYPPADPAVGGGAMSPLARFYPAGPFDFGGRFLPLPADGRVPGLEDWRWVPTPGHSPGHVAFFRPLDRVLLAGDAFVTTKQESAIAALLKTNGVHRPPAYFTMDWDEARKSVERLAALDPVVAATGHGLPVRGDDLRRGLGQLLEGWEQVARPRHGRYATIPAATDENGVISIPPPVPDPLLITLMGVATAGLVLGAALAKTRLGQAHRA